MNKIQANKNGISILAVIVGIAGASLIFFLVSLFLISTGVFRGVDGDNPEYLRKVQKDFDAGILIAVIFSSFAGGFISSLISPRKKKNSFITGVLLMIIFFLFDEVPVRDYRQQELIRLLVIIPSALLGGVLNYYKLYKDAGTEN